MLAEHVPDRLRSDAQELRRGSNGKEHTRLRRRTGEDLGGSLGDEVDLVSIQADRKAHAALRPHLPHDRLSTTPNPPSRRTAHGEPVHGSAGVGDNEGTAGGRRHFLVAEIRAHLQERAAA